MASILDDIASETGGKSFKTFKYGFDGIEVLPGMSFILEPGDVLHTPAAEAIVSQPKPL